MSLSKVMPQKDYRILDISTNDEEFTSFLFSLGCYSGEKISLISKKRNSFTIGIKDARYNIDADLADVIQVEAA